jgi:hypothetical protein
VAEREAPGKFDYLFEEIPAADSSSDQALLESPTFDDEEEGYYPAEPGPGHGVTFDAFDSSTWYFEPAPPPWYRTKQTLVVLFAAGIAAVALVVSSVLLVVRPSTTAIEEATTATPTAPTTAETRTRVATSAPSPPPPPPPPPVEVSAEPVAPAPQTQRPRSPSTRTSREPEIGVTRTPATRSPISVAPQRPGNNER